MTRIPLNGQIALARALARTLARQQAEAAGASPRQVEYACGRAEHHVRPHATVGCAVERALNDARIRPRQPQDYDPFSWIDRPPRPFPLRRWALALALFWFIFAVWLGWRYA